MKHSWVLVLAACSGPSGSTDGQVDQVMPHLIATGGVSDAPLAGELHVYAVERGTATPIAGATIQVDVSSPKFTAMAQTDGTGLASFTSDALATGAAVTVTAPGHVATTWFGIAGANVTIPLARTTVPTAHVTGTIAGWNSLPSPSLGHYTLGVVLYSFLDDPSAPENSIAQPMNGTTPLNTCINTGLSNSCAWQMNARIGTQIHTAVIVDGDAHGTSSDTSDDTYTLIGYAAGSVMTLTDGQQVTNESLAMVSGTMPLSVTFPAALADLPRTIAIPELALGDAGRIVFPLPTVSPSHTSTTVLAATGAFAGHYEVVALATPNATATVPFSTSFAHDVASSVTLPEWLRGPAILDSGPSFQFGVKGLLSDYTFGTARITRGGQPLWDLLTVSGMGFPIPSISPDPIGPGQAVITVNIANAPGFDRAHFDIASTLASLPRVAGDQLTFTR